MSDKPTDWQYSHSEMSGKEHAIANFFDSPDDPSCTLIVVKGRDGEAVARRLAELLQRSQFQSAT